MDLSNLDVVDLANKGTVLKLLHPGNGEILTDEKGKTTDDYRPFTLTLLGSDSDIYRSAQKRKSEASLNAYAKNKPKKIDLNEAERDGAELMAKCTTDCYLIEGGKPVAFSKAEMVRLYLKLPWLREQAEKHMSDRSVLMKS